MLVLRTIWQKSTCNLPSACAAPRHPSPWPHECAWHGYACAHLAKSTSYFGPPLVDSTPWLEQVAHTPRRPSPWPHWRAWGRMGRRPAPKPKAPGAPKVKAPDAPKSEAPEPRIYRYVTWNQKAKVWAVQRRGCPSPGSHPNQLEAAKLASKAFGMSLQELRLAGPEPAPGAPKEPKEAGADPPKRLYKYVSWHKASKVWVVQRRGSGNSPGCHADQHEAAKIASKAYGLSLDELLLGPGADTDMANPEPGPRRYRRISWHVHAQLWVAQAPLGKPSPGSHATQRGAALLAAKAWKVSLRCLSLDPKACRPSRKFKHVSYHRASKTWVAQLGGRRRRRLGSSRNQDEAASKAAGFLKRPLSELRLPKVQIAASCQPLEQQVVRFQQLWSTYGGDNPKDPKVPGDVADLTRRASRQGPTLLSKGSGLILPFLLAKYGPHRDIMEAAWADVAQRSLEADPVQLTYDVLAATLRKLHGQPLRQAWIENVGRNTTHHGGLIPFAIRSLGILRPATDKCGSIRLGQGGRCFHLEELGDILRLRISTMVSFGQAMLETRAPRTAQDWAQEVARLQQAAMGPPRVCGLLGPQSYRTLWVIRCWLLWCMRQANITHLRLPKDFSVGDFSRCVPDQKSWAMRLANRRASSPLVEVLAKLQYSGPPEFFAMYCCLWGCNRLRQQLEELGDKWLEVNKSTLLEARHLSPACRPLHSGTQNTVGLHVLDCSSVLPLFVSRLCCLGWSASLPRMSAPGLRGA